jgi:hypothetical protein
VAQIADDKRAAKACRHQFSVTGGTIFASRKLPIRDYLAGITIFVNAVKGISALQLDRELDDRGITTPATIGEALSMPAGEATKLLTRRQWRERDVTLLQAAATAAQAECLIPNRSTR